MSDHAANSGNETADASGSATLSTPRFCRACAYSLTNHAGPKCPECGREFDPANPKTFDASPRRRRKVVVLRCIIGLLVFALLLWLMRPSKVLVVSVYTLNVAGNRGARTVVVEGPTWTGLTYFKWSYDVPDDAAAFQGTPPKNKNQSMIWIKALRRDLTSGRRPEQIGRGSNVYSGRDGYASISVGIDSKAEKTIRIDFENLQELSAFLADNFTLLRAVGTFSRIGPGN